MYANNFEQLISFIYFIIVGIVLSIIFDIFRILRRTIKTSDIVTNIQDILFCIITGIIILFSIFYFNKGQLRVYIFIGIILGATFYMIFISKYFIKINVTIINFIKKILYLLIKPFIFILNFTKRLIFKPISFIIINMKCFTIKNLQKFKKVTKKTEKRCRARRNLKKNVEKYKCGELFTSVEENKKKETKELITYEKFIKNKLN